MKKYPKINIGVGGLILNKKSEILLIKRKSDPLIWTIPSGYMEENEDIFITIQREVKEETSVNIKPKGIVGLRQRITEKEGNNLWIIVIADYKSGVILPDDKEIFEARFLNYTDVSKIKTSPVTKKIIELFRRNKTNVFSLQKNFSKKNYKFFS